MPQIAATEVTYNGFTYYAGIISGKDLSSHCTSLAPR